MKGKAHSGKDDGPSYCNGAISGSPKSDSAHSEMPVGKPSTTYPKERVVLTRGGDNHPVGNPHDKDMY